MKVVRFRDPETNETIYPEPFVTPSNAITPGLVANTPTVGALLLNPLLMAATISWDVRRPFESYPAHWRQADRTALLESATLPPVERLEIVSPHLPWKIEVHPRTPNLHITVFDVMTTIQAALKLRITLSEWSRFNDTGKRLTLTAKDLRVEEYDPGRRLDEIYHHPRRVDALGEFTQFAGLIPAPQRSRNSFDLELKRRD
ncbi:hypothetical protein BDM02DRAFT_3108908 [Thelephora ganbajun]|uniref:Uncharacterized protein n=1 Tax=Thelephora ganbajun TaxID=370292 RepID=A0ACB6ZTJ1_THEGA|nr:hypothetical protein BDM02DRAFT_3108908 [Thelephora ganbajun]